MPLPTMSENSSLKSNARELDLTSSGEAKTKFVPISKNEKQIETTRFCTGRKEVVASNISNYENTSLVENLVTIVKNLTKDHAIELEEEEEEEEDMVPDPRKVVDYEENVEWREKLELEVRSPGGKIPNSCMTLNFSKRDRCYHFKQTPHF